ncbi:MAG: ABC transporter ATP-binding protein [Acidobacteriia bacterium]|nr:ABC transporter ATP-binding protein [Terriglobia bacterium]
MANELACACRKRLPSGLAVDAAFRLPLDRATVTVLFGPSGSGKTTLLRLLAGLERPDEGCVQFRDQTWFDSTRGVSLAPQLRRTGFLFQEYALFPHLTVRRNIEYAARDPRKASEWMSRFDLTWLSPRLPRSLSGGEQQRVALARALAAEPALLLLDEPLSALDSPTRGRLRQELRRELVESGIPSIIVTHDRIEAMALGDWMAVLIGGVVHQAGPIDEVFRHPANVQVAESVGVENVLPGEIVGRAEGLATVRVGGTRLECVDSGETGAVCVCIRAEDVTLAPGSAAVSSARNRLAGRIRSLVREGPLARVEVDCGFPLVAVVTAQSAGDLHLNPGDPVYAVVKATSVHLLPR